MSYTVNFSNALKNPLTVSDTTVDHTTSMNLVGKNSANYGRLFAENFIHLLENAANLSAPNAPIEGQLWYDTSIPTSKILKVYDGANWVPVNGVHQSGTNPISKRVGDIWVDTSSGQMNIWNGNSWLLIGPTASTGLKNGIYPTIINDNTGQPHNVILSYINDDIITITSKESFTPNPVISGFTSLLPGLNVSTKSFNGSTARLGGLANTALGLKVSSSADPISADNFLRSDVPGTIIGSLNVNGNSGIRIGAISQTVRVEKILNDAVLSNRFDSGNIGLSVLKNNQLNQIVTVDGLNLRVGINNIVPSVELDVTGDAAVSGMMTARTIEVTGDPLTTSLTVTGSADITSTLTVGDDTTITGQLYIDRRDSSSNPIAGAAVLPTSTNIYDIGSTDFSFNKVYAREFITTTTSFSMVPTGAVILWAGATPPDGFLFCDGTDKNNIDYPRLYNAITTSYGTTNQGVTFTLPLIPAVTATNPNINPAPQLNYIIKF